MSLSENLQRLRKEKGLSQEDVAQKLFVSRQSVSKWENGNAEPGVKDLTALADMFGVTLDELVGREWPESPAGSVTPKEPPELAWRTEKRYRRLFVFRLILFIFVQFFSAMYYGYWRRHEPIQYIALLTNTADMVALLVGQWVAAPAMWVAIICLEFINIGPALVSIGASNLYAVGGLAADLICLFIMTRPSIKARFHRA